MDDSNMPREYKLQIECACLGEQMQNAEIDMNNKKLKYENINACLKQTEESISFFQCLKRTFATLSGAFTLGGIAGLCFSNVSYGISFLIGGALSCGGAFLFNGAKKQAIENQKQLGDEFFLTRASYFDAIENFRTSKEKFETAQEKYYLERSYWGDKDEQEC